MTPPWQLPDNSKIHELGTTDRTLRRLADTGTLRVSRRVGRNRVARPGEEAYLRSHWTLLSDLRSALRTERAVRMAVLFGSVARSADHPESDLDLMVDLGNAPTLRQRWGLRRRLSQKLGRKVDLFVLDDLRSQPEILSPLLDTARPVVDREAAWPELIAQRGNLARRAERWHRRQRAILAQGLL